MIDFDIIVIGGGPAGCYAGLTAAAKGCKVAILEEHRSIGWPRHDPGWLMESVFAKSIIDSVGYRVPWAKVNEYRACHSESGDLIEKSSLGGYVVKRDLLEKEIAASAIKAGAALFLKTEVTKLVRNEGRVEGVETTSSALPKATGQIFICADGIRSAGYGFAVQEELCEKAKLQSGISYLLANAEVSAGVIDHFLSPDPLLNYRTFFTHQKGLCVLSFPSSEAFYELKNRSDNAVSRKIRNAYPLEMSGYASATSGKYAEYFKNIVRDNILFIGDASGGAGNIHGMIQGQFAGTVAASAIKDHDVSEERLFEYQDLVFNTLGKAPFFYFSAREDFGSFDEWFCQVEDATKGIEATELARFR
ncbi:NAD(P)/FAD-dependent oxidoreductase [Candidatus Bathyarchaeota archaeon]|nr:NAD(P)/FAD-dependent oxidoreductase [Candidatus Bathyarchaeota archaeon]